jgi:hypothetical protein
MAIDTSFLLGGQPPTLPDPLRMAIQGMTLAHLSSSNDEAKQKLLMQERQNKAMDAANAALPMVIQAKFSPESMQAAIQQYPDAAPVLWKANEEYAKRQDDALKAKGTFYKDELGPLSAHFGNAAAALAPRIASGEMPVDYAIGLYKKIANTPGMAEVIPHLPTLAGPDMTDPKKVAQHLFATSEAFHTIHDQVTEKETNRHATTTEGMQAGNYASEASHRKALEGIGWANANVARDRLNKEQIGAPQEVTVDGQQRWAVYDKTKKRWLDSSGGAPIAGTVGSPLSEKQRGEISDINAELKTVELALKAVQGSPEAFSAQRGMATATPMIGGGLMESMVSRSDTPEQSRARSLVYNVVSGLIKERAGTAQSKQELARLNGFLPADTDNDQQVMQKFGAYVEYLQEKSSGYSSSSTPSRSNDDAPGGVPMITPRRRQ